MEMIKVLHVIGHLGKGGDTTAVLNVMKYIEKNKRNIHFDFLTHDGYDESFVNNVKKSGHNVFILKNDARNMNPIKYYFSLKNILKENRYNCIHFHTSFQSCIGLLASRSVGIPIRICHSHTSSVQRKCNFLAKNILLPLCRKIINKTATKKIACSEEAAVNLFGVGSTYSIIYNGIDIKSLRTINIDSVQEIKEKINYNEHKIVIGQVGRFSDMKNQLFTLELAKELKTNTNILFVFLGDGELIDKCKVIANGLSNVYFMGKVNNVNDYMYLFDYLVIPSKYGEGLPTVAVEQQIVNPKCICIANINITQEANLGNVRYVDIKEKSKWIEILSDKHQFLVNEVNYSNFDINNTAKNWINFYYN